MDFLSAVEAQLDMPRADKAQVMREITSHYQDTREELVSKGMDEAQADREAARNGGGGQAKRHDGSRDGVWQQGALVVWASDGQSPPKPLACGAGKVWATRLRAGS